MITYPDAKTKVAMLETIVNHLENPDDYRSTKGDSWSFAARGGYSARIDWHLLSFVQRNDSETQDFFDAQGLLEEVVALAGKHMAKQGKAVQHPVEGPTAPDFTAQNTSSVMVGWGGDLHKSITAAAKQLLSQYRNEVAGPTAQEESRAAMEAEAPWPKDVKPQGTAATPPARVRDLEAEALGLIA